MRILSVAAAICLLFAASIFPANAQESVKDLAAKASAELRLLTAFQTLERMTSQMSHFLVYAIESERGGWDIVEFNNAPDGTNANVYMIRSTAEDVQLEIARANISIMKSKVATEDELKGAEATVANLGVLVSLAPQIADIWLHRANLMRLHYSSKKRDNRLTKMRFAEHKVQLALCKNALARRFS